MAKRLTRKQAIVECKSVWEIIKRDYHGDKLEALQKLPELGKYYVGCPLCSWVMQGKPCIKNPISNKIDSAVWCWERKRICPLMKQYGKSCIQLGYSIEVAKSKWYQALNDLK